MFFVASIVGCSRPTEAARDNRRLVDAILTAITTKNAAELNKDERLLDERHESRGIEDKEFQALTAIIAKAKAGSWQEAEGELYRFRDAHPFPR